MPDQREAREWGRGRGGSSLKCESEEQIKPLGELANLSRALSLDRFVLAVGKEGGGEINLLNISQWHTSLLP